jgi:hypothetical protein
MASKKNEKNSKLSKSATRNNIIDEIVEEDDDSGNVNARTSVSLKKNNNGKRKSNAPNSYESSSSSFSIPNNQGFKRKILNFSIMSPGPHNAENIKIAVEKIINQYTFDKSKIKGVVCDEGSSLVRLFKQLTSFLGIEIDELEEIKDDDQLDKEEMVVRVADVDEEITDLINNDLIPLQDKLDASQLQDGEDDDDDELNESEDKSNEYDLSDGHQLIENLTRWSSSFLMLNSFYKAYLRKCFNDEMKCPVSITKIEFYLKLLLPAYRFSLVYQRNKSHIGDVLPGLLLLIEQYKSLGKKRGAGIFCSTFIKYLKKKFHYELNAPIYAIAALLNVSSLHMWYKKPFGKDYIKQD